MYKTEKITTLNSCHPCILSAGISQSIFLMRRVCQISFYKHNGFFFFCNLFCVCVPPLIQFKCCFLKEGLHFFKNDQIQPLNKWMNFGSSFRVIWTFLTYSLLKIT